MSDLFDGLPVNLLAFRGALLPPEGRSCRVRPFAANSILVAPGRTTL